MSEQKGLRKTSTLILNYLILIILIGAIIFTLSSDFIPLLRKRVLEELKSPTIKQSEIVLEQTSSEADLTYEQNLADDTKNLEEKPKYFLEKSIFPHESPFEIYIPSIDVTSNVNEGEFREHSDLEKIVMLKELPTKDGGKFSFNYPGEEGACIIVGHHLKGDRLFGALEYVKKDDEVILTSSNPKVILTYKVDEIIPYVDKYTSAEMFMVKEGESRLFLLTCSYRVGKPKTRFMVVCELVDVERKD